MLSLYDVTMVIEFVPPELIFTVLTITQRGVREEWGQGYKICA